MLFADCSVRARVAKSRCTNNAKLHIKKMPNSFKQAETGQLLPVLNYLEWMSNGTSTTLLGTKLRLLAALISPEIQSEFRGKRTHDFLTYDFTRQGISLFTCQTHAKTITMHSFFHSKNHIFMLTFFGKVFDYTPSVMTSVPKKIMNFRLLMKPDLLGRILIAMMESRDLVSVSRRVSRPILFKPHTASCLWNTAYTARRTIWVLKCPCVLLSPCITSSKAAFEQSFRA